MTLLRARRLATFALLGIVMAASHPSLDRSLTRPAAHAVWTRTEQFTGASTCALVMSPGFQQDRTAWAGTLESGLFVSHDGARTWVRVPLPQSTLPPCPISFSPDYPRDHTIVAVMDQAYVSHDSGQTWTALGLPSPPSVVAFSPASRRAARSWLPKTAAVCRC